MDVAYNLLGTIIQVCILNVLFGFLCFSVSVFMVPTNKVVLGLCQHATALMHRVSPESIMHIL